MPLTCDTIGPLLAGYCDGELSGDERQLVAEHLAGCATCAALVATDRRLANHIAAGGIAGSEGFARRIARALDREDNDQGAASRAAIAVPMQPARLRQGERWQARAAAVVAACLVSAGAGWFAAQRMQAAGDIEMAVLHAHMRALLQDNPIQVASSDNHVVKPWFNGRIDVAPQVKDLSQHGFALVGGRLDLIGDRRAAVCVYRRRLHFVNVYVMAAPGAGDADPAMSTRNGFNALHWTRAGVSYWAVSDINAAELGEFQALL